MKNFTTSLEQKIILRKVSKWRFFTIFLIFLFLFKFVFLTNFKVFQEDYVAQIWIKGFISNNYPLQQKLENILKNNRVKAVIVNIDSPGGTFVGGEKIYQLLKKFSKTKPVISLLGNQATSAGYLISLGTSHIVANQGTLTGSVGVMLQSFEATNLAKKIGVKPIILKSSELKATPHPAEELTIKGRKYLQDLVEQSQDIFLSIVKERRKNITQANLIDIAQGKVYIGEKAQEMNLIDQVGGYDEVLAWLNKRRVNTNNIVNIDLYQKKNTAIADILRTFSFEKIDAITQLDMIDFFNYKLLSF